MPGPESLKPLGFRFCSAARPFRGKNERGEIGERSPVSGFSGGRA
jgi:hypothetical protein